MQYGKSTLWAGQMYIIAANQINHLHWIHNLGIDVREGLDCGDMCHVLGNPRGTQRRGIDVSLARRIRIQTARSTSFRWSIVRAWHCKVRARLAFVRCTTWCAFDPSTVAEIAGLCDSASFFGCGFRVAHGYSSVVIWLINKNTSCEG
jgi:hypothetical protein